MTKSQNTADIVDVLQALLSELRYVHSTGDLRDSERNSAELRENAARLLGYANYAEFGDDMDAQG